MSACIQTPQIETVESLCGKSEVTFKSIDQFYMAQIFGTESTVCEACKDKLTMALFSS